MEYLMINLCDCPERLNYYINHDEIRPNITQDSDPEYLDATELLKQPGTYFFAGDGIALLCWGVGDKIYEADIYALPRKMGRPAKDAAKQVIDYMFCVAKAGKIIIRVPSFNKAAQTFDYGLGFRRFKVEPGAWVKHNKCYDLIWYELRAEWAE